MKNNTWTVSTDDLKFEIQDKVKLTAKEAEVYSTIFDKEVGAPVKVRESLKNNLSKLVDMGLDEHEKYPKFIVLAHEAMDHDFDSVERDRLHVINDGSSYEVICRHKTGGEWKFVASIEKSLIRDLYKNRGTRILGNDITITAPNPIKLKGSSNVSTTSSDTRTYNIGKK